jgi:hypothetical protein
MDNVFIPSDPNDRLRTEAEYQNWMNERENRKDDFPYIALTRTQLDLLSRSQDDAVLVTEENENDIAVLCGHGFVYRLENGGKVGILANKRGENYLAYEKQESSKECRLTIKDIIVALIGAVCGFLLNCLLNG